MGHSARVETDDKDTCMKEASPPPGTSGRPTRALASRTTSAVSPPPWPPAWRGGRGGPAARPGDYTASAWLNVLSFIFRFGECINFVESKPWKS